jgi:hypothetical protein
VLVLSVACTSGIEGRCERVLFILKRSTGRARKDRVFAPSFDGAFASRRIYMVILFQVETESSLELRIRFIFCKTCG